MRLKVCGGFDGSEVDDWTCIRLETIDGYQFTPTYGPDDRPTYWDPAEWGGRVPRLEVESAWQQIFASYDVERVYYDPPWWQSEGERWAATYGEKIFLPWETYRLKPMHEALQRFVVDLTTGAIKHDGCEQTEIHMANARKVARSGDRYLLSKPAGAYHQKIDLAVTSVIAHEAAADARADGWGRRRPNASISTAMYGFN